MDIVDETPPRPYTPLMMSTTRISMNRRRSRFAAGDRV